MSEDILVRRRPELFRFHRIDLISKTNRLDNGDPSDTALGGCFERDDPTLSEDWFLRTLGDFEALGSEFPALDAFVILFNSDLGRANANLEVATGAGLRSVTDRSIRMSLADDAEVLTHELGHLLFGLGDEYSDSDAPHPESRYVTSTVDPLMVTPNLSLQPDGAKWADHVEGARPGGRRYGSGIYHPTDECRMLDLAHDRFCPVCEHRIEQVLTIFTSKDTNDGLPQCGFDLDQVPHQVSGPFDLQVRGFDLNGLRIDRLAIDGQAHPRECEPCPAKPPPGWSLGALGGLAGHEGPNVITATQAVCLSRCFDFQSTVLLGFASGEFDGDTLGAGPHELSLRCVDALGLESEAKLQLQVR